MLRNYFKIALRNILKNKLYSVINILGLAIGVAVFFIALQFSFYHHSWDEFHSKSEDIYRIHQKFNDGGTTAHCSYPIKNALVADYSEIQLATQFGIQQRQKLFMGDEQIVGENILFIEPSFYDMFDIQFIDTDKALIQREMEANVNQAILTEEYAHVLFANQDPIGKTFTLGEGEQALYYVVRALVKQLPETSHFQFNILVPIASQPFFKTVEDNWNNPVVFTYVYIPDKAKGREFAKIETLDMFIAKHFPPKYGGPEAHLPVMPMEDIHLHSSVYFELGQNSNILLVWIVGSIGLLILILASVNFMNLTTARATRRAKEVGMRKSLGASKKHLVYQFLGEAIIFSFLAVLVGMLLAEVFIYQFNAYLNENLTIRYFNNGFTLPILFLLVLLVGVISGSYPAFVLASFNPLKALKETRAMRSVSGFLVRKGLVILQFIVVALLLVTIITMQGQLSYLAGMDIGYDNKNLVFVRSSDQMMENPQYYQSFLTELRDNGAVEGIAGFGGWAYQSVDFEGMKPNEREGSIILTTSADYPQTMQLKLLAGRFPDRTNKADLNGIIFNQTAIRNFHWAPEEAIGKTVKLFEGDSTYRVIGVFQDYHFDDLTSKIEPLAMIVSHNELYGNTLMRLSGDREASLAAVRTAWDRYDDGWPFEIFFSEDEMAESLNTIINIKSMMRDLTYLGIFIACMGLWGLTVFSTERRVKEIGIRKVLGASIVTIWQLIVSEFVVLVLIATIIGITLGYFTGDLLLQNFAYKIDIDAKILALSALIALLIAVVTVSYQAIKSAIMDPVNAIRLE